VAAFELGENCYPRAHDDRAFLGHLRTLLVGPNREMDQRMGIAEAHRWTDNPEAYPHERRATRFHQCMACLCLRVRRADRPGREALEQTKREQNRVRLRPSNRQVIVCETVISWPLYLTDRELRPTPVRDSLPRRTKATLIYRRTGNLRAVQLLLGTPRSKAPSDTSVEVDEAIAIAEQVEV
jgi:hypothetical protein